jgi:hypothetical protein
MEFNNKTAVHHTLLLSRRFTAKPAQPRIWTQLPVKQLSRMKA